MKEPNSILVVADAQQDATALVGKALAIARQCNLGIELFECAAEEAYELSRAYDREDVDKARTTILSHARAHLADLMSQAQASDVRMSVEAQCESPLYQAVVRKALRSKPALVMKALPAGAGVLDPNDWQLMRTCPATLMLTGHRSWSRPPRFAAAVDLSEQETEGLPQQVLEAARLLARAFRGELDVIYGDSSNGAAGKPSVLRLRELCGTQGIAPERAHVVQGIPETSLPAFAARQGYDLLVLGALEHRPELTQVGTLTSKLIDSLDCDFVLVKPAGYHSPLEEDPERTAHRKLRAASESS